MGNSRDAVSSTLYRYGPLQWLWRTIIAAALLAGSVMIWHGVRLGEPYLLVIAATLIAPSLFFGAVVAVRIDDNRDGTIDIHTLFPSRRRVARTSIGKPRLREHYQGEVQRIYAPALWVRDGTWLPIYIDLFGRIVDRRKFAAVFHVRETTLPRR